MMMMMMMINDNNLYTASWCTDNIHWPDRLLIKNYEKNWPGASAGPDTLSEVVRQSWWRCSETENMQQQVEKVQWQSTVY